tara:strand:- start:560 stop:790 length:231 start_codon:yes stop_codon:yes gene_type:complete
MLKNFDYGLALVTTFKLLFKFSFRFTVAYVCIVLALVFIFIPPISAMFFGALDGVFLGLIGATPTYNASLTDNKRY